MKMKHAHLKINMSAPFHRLMLLELMDTKSGGNQVDTTKTQLAKGLLEMKNQNLLAVHDDALVTAQGYDPEIFHSYDLLVVAMTHSKYPLSEDLVQGQVMF